MKDKLDLQSTDITSLNIEKIAALFPSCVTETAEGKKIDFDLLKQELSTEIVKGNKERYRLEWPGKRESIVNANLPTTNTLRPIREDSVDFDTTENIYIEGDNLEVLKLLQESYLSKIKMIYIDPPYNTGKDFVYKDNFAKTGDEELIESGQKDKYNQRLVANPETSGRYHSDWLSMMYPRLKLARNLLTEDGVIFISIDDNEVHNLRKICDEIFGEGNFVGNIIWETATDNNPSQIAVEHEYVICYSKNKLNLGIWQVQSEKAQIILEKYEQFKKNNLSVKEIQLNLRAWINSNKKSNAVDLSGVSHYNYVDHKGVFYPGNPANTKKGGYDLDIVHPITRKICVKPENGFRWPLTTFRKADNEGDVLWGDDENTIPKIKKRIESATELFKSYFYQDNRITTNMLKELFDNKKIFENPKSLNLLKKSISFASDKKAIILDFYSGSATTAHAVMQLNAEDIGNRKYIMVQLPEITDEKSEAYKAGYLNICEIGKERIRRAANKIKEETKANIDYGFRVYRLDSSNMQDVYYKPQDYNQGTLDLFADNVKEGRTAEDLLTQVMLDWGLPLSLPIERKTISGKEVYAVAGDSLYCCFDDGIDEAFAKEIAQEKPLRIVFRDKGFKDDTAKENVKQLLKQLSGRTEMRVI
ncbi:site-specific DNA-methyltransferase [Chryseobacterium chendengshani]|uniref:site-specific DNA-methyltransferase n=1 Tax=Chryseobacterium sp. LJ668 TaxID=2864040 RepID=UPI001C68CE17|nr:site-specific DNA-methyltransferase [Chryseobacterium sp. LJ668]MBW8523698.1 site-specific DNA-methyltransferase [Chryseobacterium sp. LJ668]QYK15978.1 site-specific DNA-methyltransferase [Chryseobacterium sp. LJ668]